MYTVSSPQPVGCVASRTLNDKNLIEMVDRSSSSPPREQVVPSLGKSGVSRVSDGACGRRGAAEAVLVSHGDARGQPRPEQGTSARAALLPRAPGRPLLTLFPLPALPFSFTPLKHQQKYPSALFINACFYTFGFR